MSPALFSARDLVRLDVARVGQQLNLPGNRRPHVRHQVEEPVEAEAVHGHDEDPGRPAPRERMGPLDRFLPGERRLLNGGMRLGEGAEAQPPSQGAMSTPICPSSRPAAWNRRRETASATARVSPASSEPGGKLNR